MKNYNDKSGLAYYWLEDNIGRVLLVVLFACLGLWGLLLEGREDLELGRRLVRGMGPELAGIVIAAVTIDALAERRQTEQFKAQLIRQMGSRHNEVADTAARELAHYGWLFDGSLNWAFLEGANLYEVELEGAVLNGVILTGADLTHAFMTRVQLQSAILLRAEMNRAMLVYANLRNAILGGANLNAAILGDANLSEADLVNADLSDSKLQNVDFSKAVFQGANLARANLRGANLTEIKLWTIVQISQAGNLSSTVMPDGVRLGRILDESEAVVDGPSFDYWKAECLVKHGGTETDLRDPL